MNESANHTTAHIIWTCERKQNICKLFIIYLSLNHLIWRHMTFILTVLFLQLKGVRCTSYFPDYVAAVTQMATPLSWRTRELAAYFNQIGFVWPTESCSVCQLRIFIVIPEILYIKITKILFHNIYFMKNNYNVVQSLH